MSGPRAGHTVLAVPVPALDAWVRERTRGYDAAWVASDPGFVHAHVTVLAPWVPVPTAEDLARVGALVGAVAAFEARLADVAVFASGLVHLRPEPREGFAALTTLVADAYPDHPPYEGRHGAVEPHLSLDVLGPGPAPHDRPVTRASVVADVAALLPVTTRVDRVDLQWWQEGRCHRLASFPLGPLGAGQDGTPDGPRRPV